MNYEDFIRKPENEPEEMADVQGEPSVEEVVTPVSEEDIDVQKAVVESLAAEKVEQDEKIAALEGEKSALAAEKANLISEKLRLEGEKKELEESIEKLRTTMNEMRKSLENVGEILARNSEKPVSNQVSVLDRNEEVSDRFDGETRDHILEVIKEARDAAEAAGRLRRAQLLEAVLAANEPTGELEKRRVALEKLFADNLNIINGQVINELDKLDIRYKDGENYLLAKEIIRRSY